MLGGVAVNFAGRCLQDRNLDPFCKAQHVDRADDGHLRRLDGVVLIMNRRGGASEVEDGIDLDEQRMTDIVPQEFKTRMRQQMRDIRLRAGKEVVDTKDFVAARDKPVDEVRPDEACASRHQNSPSHKIFARHRNSPE